MKPILCLWDFFLVFYQQKPHNGLLQVSFSKCCLMFGITVCDFYLGVPMILHIHLSKVNFFIFIELSFDQKNNVTIFPQVFPNTFPLQMLRKWESEERLTQQDWRPPHWVLVLSALLSTWQRDTWRPLCWYNLNNNLGLTVTTHQPNTISQQEAPLALLGGISDFSFPILSMGAC